MEHIIPGLLLGSCSIYALRQCMEAELNLMYSSSLGSIQAAIRKLSAQGFLEVQEKATGKRKKKVYSITGSGKDAFSLWVDSSISGASARNPELGKLYFMGFSDPALRCENLRRTIEDLQAPYAALRAIAAEGETMEIPEQGREILHYQLASARFGRDFLRFQIDWFQDFLIQEEKRF